VLQAHREDLVGIACFVLALLAGLAVYGNALGPGGHLLRVLLGDLLGVSRFIVPLAFAVTAILLVVGRGRPEPVRSGIGAVLVLVASSGLGELVGGRPGFSAASVKLSGAGGWVGVLVGKPLSASLSPPGAAVVLAAFAVVGLLVVTGATLRGILHAIWAMLARRGSAVEDETATGATRTDIQDQVVTEVEVRETSCQADEPGEPDEEATGKPNEQQGALTEVAAGGPMGIAGDGLEGSGDPLGAVQPSGVSEATLALQHGIGDGGKAEQLKLDLGVPRGDWRLPPERLLKRSRQRELDVSEVKAAGSALVDALAAHGVETRLVGYTVGPTVTRFELELGSGVKVARVTSLAKDIAYAMASPDVRILAPIPGKSAIGVEVPNRTRQLVTLGDILASQEAKAATHPLQVALGRDIAGRPVMANLADMPHLLISGATGAGKSSCINSILTSILMRSTPEEVRLILVDPKRVELGQYNGLPHLLTAVVVDPKKAANALSWAVKEMERRYDLLAEAGLRDITGYNAAVRKGDFASDHLLPHLTAGARASERGGEAAAEQEAAEHAGADQEQLRHRPLPYVLVVVDELNDLMMVAARDVEESVCRIAQMARAVGIHLVLATQRPSVDVITGVIKANIPSRLAFSVSSLADSRVILDQPGAERLVGRGDMLLLTASSSVPRRIQGPWVTEEEVRAVVATWRRQSSPDYVEGIEGEVASSGANSGADDEDELLQAAMELVVRSQLGSTSMLQRKLRVGFSRAGRLMDLLERRGVVGPSEGSKARAVLMTPEELDALADR